MNYLDSVSQFAAARVRSGARESVGRIVNVLRGATPNDLGNYRGKRQPKPAPKPLTAEERFFLLAATYEAFRQKTKIQRRETQAAQAATAKTRREARAARHAARFDRYRLAAA